ncbi:hypothetical protein INT47_001285 [Mucor saturninus]|uniref:Protein EFR3 n=1 Tax=Mucor saturninus TaxID=64648 RepID=A0A8H7VGU9_9FUNG|nr:hypothetical protein INT47_001285 [Mucor saturninus]
MTGCFCIGNVKHATLIKNCYPPTGTVPRSSELSYLTFYASSRPAKLTKVGTFLQRKVTKDIRKGRKSSNAVSLLILKALIQTCHRDLNLFSKYIVKILSLLLDTRDLELIDLTCETFIVFCTFHDGTTLGVDADFTTDYETLLQKFAGFCNYTTEDPSLAQKMRYIGHRAIQAAVTSGALQSSDFKTQLSILFPPLIVTLASSSNNMDALETSDGSIDIRESALNHSKVINDQLIGWVAAHTISILFNKVTGPSVRLSLVPLFEYMNKKEKWWPPNLAVNIMKLVLDSLQPQYRYLLVSDILHQLDLNDENHLINDKYASLVSILDSILNANTPLVGISVLEVLNSLFSLLIKTTHHHAFLSNNDHAGYGHVIQRGLVHSIGGLATQTYYENQLNDMVGYLVSKTRPNTSLETVDNMSIYDYRLIVLCCLDSVVMGSSKTLQQTEFPYEALNPALELLHDKNPLTRIAFSKSLYGVLQTVSSHANDSANTYAASHYHDAIFLDRLVHVMQDWVLMPDFNITDLRFFYSFLCQLTRKFGMAATVMIVPLIFKVQQSIRDGHVGMDERAYALESCLISSFLMMSQYYGLPALAEYMQEVKEKRGLRTDDVMLTESLNETMQYEPEVFRRRTGNQDNLDEDWRRNRSSAVWIDRSQVVEIMSKEGKLRGKGDPHGLELEAKLFAEWGSDAFLKKDQSIRTRIFQDSNENKPKLSNPWEPSSEYVAVTREDRKNSIRVATLKEALTAQLSAEEEVDSDSTQSNSISAHSKPFKMDMNALLNELNLPPVTPSTVSLVNPPYKST